MLFLKHFCCWHCPLVAAWEVTAQMTNISKMLSSVQIHTREEKGGISNYIVEAYYMWLLYYCWFVGFFLGGGGRWRDCCLVCLAFTAQMMIEMSIVTHSDMKTPEEIHKMYNHMLYHNFLAQIHFFFLFVCLILTESKHGGNKNGKKEGLSGSSFFTWFMVIALLGVWTSVAVVWFELVDYEEVLGKNFKS